MKMKKIAMALTSILLSASPFNAQDHDPFAVGEPERIEKEIVAEDVGYELTFEVFEMPITAAAEMRRTHRESAKAYDFLLKQVKEKKAALAKLLAVHSLDGQAATVEQIKEYIYPTEYEPPEIGVLPRDLPKGFTDFDKFITPATPSAFDTKNVGDTLRVELEGHPDRAGEVAGRITFSHVALLGELEWGTDESKVKLPEFRVQKISTSAKLVFGEPLLLGTVAAPTSGKEEKENRVWVAFATVTKKSE